MMTTFFLLCIFFIGLGLFSIWWGRKAINERRVSNSLKSSLITGVKEISGDNAVQTGKLLVVIGVIIATLATLVLIGGIVLAVLGTALESDFPGKDRRDRIRDRQRSRLEP